MLVEVFCRALIWTDCFLSLKEQEFHPPLPQLCGLSLLRLFSRDPVRLKGCMCEARARVFSWMSQDIDLRCDGHSTC